MEKKPVYSKTVWFNLIVAVAAFFPAAQDYVAANSQSVLIGIATVGMILRFLTKGKIAIE